MPVASPEELIAGAHATCFTMALALVLGEAGTPPERLATDARCLLDEPSFRDAVDRASALDAA